MEELSEYNDLNLITQYCKEVTLLQKRLTEIQDQITQINKVRQLIAMLSHLGKCFIAKVISEILLVR